MNRIKKLIAWLRQPVILGRTVILASAVIVAGLVLYLIGSYGRITIDTSKISAPLVSVSPMTPGTLTDVSVTPGQQIRKGDALAVVGGSVLRAETGGLVVTTNKAIGSIVSAATPVVQLVDLRNMRVDATIDENKGLNKLKIGQATSFTVDALPGRIFWGYVESISETAKATQLSFSISNERPTQQFDVYVAFDTYRYPEIKNGMSAKLTVYTNTR